MDNSIKDNHGVVHNTTSFSNCFIIFKNSRSVKQLLQKIMICEEAHSAISKHVNKENYIWYETHPRVTTTKVNV